MLHLWIILIERGFLQGDVGSPELVPERRAPGVISVSSVIPFRNLCLYLKNCSFKLLTCQDILTIGWC